MKKVYTPKQDSQVFDIIQKYINEGLTLQYLSDTISSDYSLMVKNMTEEFLSSEILPDGTIIGKNMETIAKENKLKFYKSIQKVAIPCKDGKVRRYDLVKKMERDARNLLKSCAVESSVKRLEELGGDLIIVSTHSDERPKCALDSGKTFSLTNKRGTYLNYNNKKVKFYPISTSTQGEPDGLFGINCRHQAYPEFPKEILDIF